MIIRSLQDYEMLYLKEQPVELWGEMGYVGFCDIVSGIEDKYICVSDTFGVFNSFADYIFQMRDQIIRNVEHEYFKLADGKMVALCSLRDKDLRCRLYKLIPYTKYAINAQKGIILLDKVNKVKHKFRDGETFRLYYEEASRPPRSKAHHCLYTVRYLNDKWALIISEQENKIIRCDRFDEEIKPPNEQELRISRKRKARPVRRKC